MPPSERCEVQVASLRLISDRRANAQIWGRLTPRRALAVPFRALMAVQDLVAAVPRQATQFLLRVSGEDERNRCTNIPVRGRDLPPDGGSN